MIIKILFIILNELQEVPVEEFIHISKQMKSPIITITDELSATAFNYVVAVADKLKLVFFIVKGTRKLAFINDFKVAEKICNILKVKRQCMFYYSKAKEISKTYKRYIVRAFDENNNKKDFLSWIIRLIIGIVLKKL